MLNHSIVYSIVLVGRHCTYKNTYITANVKVPVYALPSKPPGRRFFLKMLADEDEWLTYIALRTIDVHCGAVTVFSNSYTMSLTVPLVWNKLYV